MTSSDGESLQDELQGSKVLVNKLANTTLRSSSSAASLSSRPGRHWKKRSSAESSELSATTTPGTFSARGDTISESNADLVVPRVTLQEQQSEIPESGGETGHLRVIVCGDSGIGKTALIRSLTNMPEVISCETATHSVVTLSTNLYDDENSDDGELNVDDDGEQYRPQQQYQRQQYFRQSPSDIDHVIQEVYASTVTHLPVWVADDIQQIYIRNLCFIDTPGYGACLDAETVISSVATYIERQFQQTNSLLNPLQPNTPELIRLVHNPYGALTHVDVCLYVILNRIKRVDIEYMRAIHQLCNIIPVIVKCDLLTAEQEEELKLDVVRELRENEIHVYRSMAPFAISTRSSSDSDAPRSNQLWQLKDVLFYRETENLRHTTARKFVSWRATQIMASHEPTTPLLSTSTLTAAETVDRIHALRTRHAQNMNLWISRYVSEKRKLMERDMFEREKALRRELESVERRKRAEFLITELGRLFQEGPMEDVMGIKTPASSSLSSSSTQASTVEQVKNKGFMVADYLMVVLLAVCLLRVLVEILYSVGLLS